MSERKIALTSFQEGLVGAAIGIVLGGVLWQMKVISPPAVIGVAIGLGLGSWFNAWRRNRRSN